MGFSSSLKKACFDLIKSLGDFLFPKTERVIKLEKLSAEKLLAVLPPSHFEGGRDTLALFDYQDPLVKEMIWEVKYHGNRTLSQKLGAVLYDVVMAELVERNVFEKYGNADKRDNIALIPMPVSDKRRLERGWNQTELLTHSMKALDTGGHFKYLPRQLAKIRHTESQTKTATKKERLENLEKSMVVLNPHSVENRFVVLVDDVVTTGSTFKEAKRALVEAKARRVLCVALAH